MTRPPAVRPRPVAVPRPAPPTPGPPPSLCRRLTVPPRHCAAVASRGSERNALLRSACPRPVPPGGLEARRFADRLHPRRLGVRHADIGVRGLPAPPGGPVAAASRRRRARRRMRHRPVLRAGARPDRAEGVVVGVDASREMLAMAARRVADRGWRNVLLVQAPIEEAELPVVADHALFCATHDVLQSTAALDNVLSHVRDGGTVAAGGGSGRLPGAGHERGHPRAARALRARLHRLGRPWTHLSPRLHRMRVMRSRWAAVTSRRARSRPARSRSRRADRPRRRPGGEETATAPTAPAADPA